MTVWRDAKDRWFAPAMRTKVRRVPSTFLLGAAIFTVALLLVLGVIGSNMALTQRLDNSQALRNDMQQIVETVAGEAVSHTTAHLAPAEATAAVLGAELRGGDSLGLDDELMASFAHHLRAHASYDGIFVGRPDGSFMHIRRATTQEIDRRGDRVVYMTKSILLNEDGERTVSVAYLDDALSVLATEFPQADTYDPRVRPWYAAAAESANGVWTEPYIFFSSGLPGVTHAEALVNNEGKLLGVLGIDSRVADLSTFMADRQISPSGVSFIVTSSGEMVAYPQTEKLTVGRGDLARVVDVADERVLLAHAAIDDLAESAGEIAFGTLEGEEPYRLGLARLEANPDWFVAVVAPESDFLRSSRTERASLARIAAWTVVFLVILLIVLLGWALRGIGRLYRSANIDALTKLASREAIMGGLDARLRAARHGVAVLLVDLDNFKHINDGYGHAVGDAVLTAAAYRLANAAKATDLVGRLGGDEFLVVLSDCVTAEEAQSVANRMQRVLSAPVTTPEGDFPLSASVGVSVSQARCDAGELLRSADVALYAAKEAGRNRVRIFNEFMESEIDAARLMTEQLESAVELESFELWFQPEVDLATGMLCGAEALLRWETDRLGVVQAGAFVQRPEVAEAMIGSLPSILDTAVEAGRQLQSLGCSPDIRLNLNRQQLVSTELNAWFQAAQATERAMLVLELSEAALVVDDSETVECLAMLEARGARFAIDDFGTGTRSLDMLALPSVSELRIPPSIVGSLNAATAQYSTAQVVAGISKTLGHDLSAVGIETLEQLDLLVAMGYERGQGFLFSPAIRLDDLVAFARSRVVMQAMSPSSGLSDQ